MAVVECRDSLHGAVALRGFPDPARGDDYCWYLWTGPST